ncbi:MAG: PLDc N-terminal domain-containing protein, partial [Gammaproteobacteria bacterium]
MATATLALHWLLVVLLSLRVVARRLPVGVSLAWLAVLYAIPFVGAGAYLFFGGKRLGRQRLALQTALQPDIEDI